MKYAIIDWDDTLFSAYDLRKDFDKVYGKYGLSPAEVQKTIEVEIKRLNQGSAIYSPEWAVEVLFRKGLIEEEEARKLVAAKKELLKDTSRYLLQESIDFLNSLRRMGIEPIILSFGQADYQREKIDNSGLKERGRGAEIKYYIIQGNKRDFIKRELASELKGQIVYFINDKVSETKEIAQDLALKEAGIKALLKVPIYCQFPDEEFKHHCRLELKEFEESGLPYFSNFEEMLGNIKREHSENREMTREWPC